MPHYKLDITSQTLDNKCDDIIVIDEIVIDKMIPLRPIDTKLCDISAMTLNHKQ